MPERLIEILLVDDDNVDRMAVKRHVEKAKLPYSLSTGGSSAEGRKLLEEGAYDIVLLDYDLGDGTGLDLLPYAGETPAIIITGGGSETIAVDAMRLGAYDYLIKDPDRNYLTVLPSTISNVLERKRIEEEKDWLIAELQKALNNIKTLSGLVPICMHCKQVRNDTGYWQEVESFVEDHSEAAFSHGICPDCMKKYHPDLLAKMEENKAAEEGEEPPAESDGNAPAMRALEEAAALWSERKPKSEEEE
jgi:ActR/RegA family two-component response regulator